MIVERWQQLSQWFEAKPFKERLVYALLVFALIYTFFSATFFTSLDRKAKELQTQLDTARQKATQMRAQENVLAVALSKDPSASKKRELQHLEMRLESIDDNLQALAVGLIPAQALPQALHDVLDSVGSLTLNTMHTLAPERLSLAVENSVDDSAGIFDQEDFVGDRVNASRDIGVFKHSVLVSLDGPYFELLNYLKTLEALSWKIYWETLDYRVESYPNASITIEVYTLSTEAGVLGV